MREDVDLTIPLIGDYPVNTLFVAPFIANVGRIIDIFFCDRSISGDPNELCKYIKIQTNWKMKMF